METKSLTGTRSVSLNLWKKNQLRINPSQQERRKMTQKEVTYPVLKVSLAARKKIEKVRLRTSLEVGFHVLARENNPSKSQQRRRRNQRSLLEELVRKRVAYSRMHR